LPIGPGEENFIFGEDKFYKWQLKKIIVADRGLVARVYGTKFFVRFALSFCSDPTAFKMSI